MNRAITLAAAIAVSTFSYANAADTKMDKASPPTAMKMECTKADMMKMNTKIDGMSSADNKKLAMNHMSMAKDSMAKKDMTACSMHLKKAEDAMGKS